MAVCFMRYSRCNILPSGRCGYILRCGTCQISGKALVSCTTSRQNHSHTAASARSSERRTRAAGRVLWYLVVIGDDLRIDLWQPHIGRAESAKDNPIHNVVVLCCLHMCIKSEQESPSMSYQDAPGNSRRILYTLNIIEHHRMMKTNPHCHCALQALLHNNACIFLNIATLPLAVTRSGRCDRYIDRSRAWAVTCLKRRSRLRSGVGNQGMV